MDNLQNKEWLKDQYEVQQKSMRTIALEIGVTTPVVSKYIKRYGFNVRSAGESKSLSSRKNGPKSRNTNAQMSLSNKDWLYQKYIVEGLSTRDIVKLIGLKNRRTVKRALISHGIPVRDLKVARQNRSNKGPEFRSTVPSSLNNIEYLIELYVRQNKSIKEIRRIIGCSGRAIQRRLQSANVKLRNCNEANVGRRHSIETIAKMSETATNQILSGIRSSYSNGHRVNCLVSRNKFVTMRSSWEKRYAEYLKLSNIEFEYEPKVFSLSNGKSYVADFYLPATDEYIEIKGYLSDDQSDKYELFKKEYPDIKWKILYKEDLIKMGLNLTNQFPTIYLLVGAPAAGKSWVANQLTDKFSYISYDGNNKKTHLDLLRSAPVDKPIIYDPTFKISTFIRRHSTEFNIKLVAIQESEPTLRQRISQRGGKWTDTIMRRNAEIKKRYEKYGANGFIGTSDQVLKFLQEQL